MQKTKDLKKGDIYCCNFGEDKGSVQNGIRPALILQANKINCKSSTIIVAAITSENKKTNMSSHIVLGKKFGLIMPSMVMLEQIRVVNKSEIGEYIGHINDEKIWEEINNGIRKTFGLLTYGNRRSEIRCLCSKCLKEYFSANLYIIRRVEPYDRTKIRCEKCKEYGYDYYVTDKRTSIEG